METTVAAIVIFIGGMVWLLVYAARHDAVVVRQRQADWADWQRRQAWAPPYYPPYPPPVVIVNQITPPPQHYHKHWHQAPQLPPATTKEES